MTKFLPKKKKKLTTCNTLLLNSIVIIDRHRVEWAPFFLEQKNYIFFFISRQSYGKCCKIHVSLDIAIYLKEDTKSMSM